MNWWLMALAFILGLVLTWLWTVRTATREIAVHRTTPADASGQSASRTALPGSGQTAPAAAQATPAASPSPEATQAAPAASQPARTTTVPPAAAAPVSTSKAAKQAKLHKKGKHSAPYGEGSAVAGPNGAGPEGWQVKALQDQKMFHTPESPSFAETRAEIWFKDTEAAEAAGFRRWDAPAKENATV